MSPTIVRTARALWALVVCAFFAAPLTSLFRHPGAGALFPALIVVLAAVTLWRPGAGLAALVALLPLAHLLSIWIAGSPAPDQLTPALLFAFVSAGALRLAAPAPGARSRLDRPALVLGAIVLTSAIVDIVRQHAADPSQSVGGELWRNVTARYFFDAQAFADPHTSYLWLAGLTLAVFAERVLTRQPAIGPLVIRLWLLGGVAASWSSLSRIIDIVARRPGHGFETLVWIAQNYRFNALFPDVNAGGSYFALYLVAAVVLGVACRSIWILGGVVPFLLVAFLAPQSRAAIVAAALVLALIGLAHLWRTRRFIVAGVIVTVLGLGAGASAVVTRSSHASPEDAAAIRVEMTRVALRLARAHPLWGVGLDNYKASSRPYITERLPALFAFAPRGENAHDNFLQVLVELGAPALGAFLWLVLPVSWPSRQLRPARAPNEARALRAGLAAFLLSALLGHPLLIPQVAAAFFLAVGLSAGLMPLAIAPRAGRWIAGAAVVLVLLALPWRLAELSASARVDEGIGEVAGTIDGIEYRPARSGARWHVAARATTVELPIRLAAPVPAACEIVVLFDHAEADRVYVTADAWSLLRFRLPSPDVGVRERDLELSTSDARCQLWAGPLRVGR